MNFLSLDHDSLFTFDHLEIQLLNILIHLRNPTLMNKHHIINQPCHFNPILLFLHEPIIALLPPHIDPQRHNTAILHPTDQIFLIMRNYQTCDRQRMDLRFMAVRQFESHGFGIQRHEFEQFFDEGPGVDPDSSDGSSAEKQFYLAGDDHRLDGHAVR